MIRSWAILPVLAFVILPNTYIPVVSSVLRAQAPELSEQDLKDAEADKSQQPESEKKTSLKSPRRTMTTFLWAMEKKDYGIAATALDFSKVDPAPDSFEQVKYSQHVNACILHLALVDHSQISDAEDGPPVPFPPQQTDSLVVLSRGEDGLWRFSAETVANAESIFKILQEKSPTEETTPAAKQPETNATPASDTTEPQKTADTVEPSKKADSVPEGLQSARRTMRTLFDSIEEKNYASAVATLDFSEMEQQNPDLNAYSKLGYVRRLKETIERLKQIDYAAISDDPQAPTFRFPPDQPNQPIKIARLQDGAWKFTADTVGRIDALHEVYKNKPVLNLAEEDRPWYMRELVLGNETWRILALFGSIFLSLLLGQFLRSLLLARANKLEKRDRSTRSAIYRTLAKASVGLFFLGGLTTGLSALILDHKMESLVMTVLHVIFAVVVGYICFRLVDVVADLLYKLTERSDSSLNNMIVPIVSTALRLTVVILVVLEIATAISDQPPSAVLAGLGAGGLAIGLAAQETIRNLFGSVMIFADRPFELGERIVVDGHDGPVESVGFRSTRIRTLQGHLVTVPNGEMANKTIQNIGQRSFIRRTMNIRIASDTPPEKIRRALEILRELLDDHEGMKEELPPRVFLEDFLESAINLRTIYWYHPPDYWEFCAFGERLNMLVVEQFLAAEVRFAVPTQQIILKRDHEQFTNVDSKN